jgi:acyl-CoA dehydrogenase
MAELALSEAIAFAKQRTAFGKKIAEFQAIQHMLADSATELYAARQLLTDVAWHAEQHGLDGAKCSMAKLFCTEAGSRAVDRALQIFGGTGYCRGVIVERLYRDIRVSRIYEGSCEIQRNQIAKSLLN